MLGGLKYLDGEVMKQAALGDATLPDGVVQEIGRVAGKLAGSCREVRQREMCSPVELTCAIALLRYKQAHVNHGLSKCLESGL
jgi:hypothetical protein